MSEDKKNVTRMRLCKHCGKVIRKGEQYRSIPTPTGTWDVHVACLHKGTGRD